MGKRMLFVERYAHTHKKIIWQSKEIGLSEIFGISKNLRYTEDFKKVESFKITTNS